MIDSIITFLAEIFNEYIRLKFDLNEDKLVFSNLMNPDGSVALKEQNKIVVSIVNIQEERMTRGGSRSFGQGSFNEKGFFRPPVHLNVYLLFSVNFEPQLFNEGLKFLSIVVSFFQAKNVFEQANYPNLHPAIQKLIFEMENLTFQEQNNLWGSLGCKYLPSVLYKVRMLTISENVMIQLGSEIKERND